ncbi:PTS sugar transporter subunit IIA [Lactiplantibacillus paraplantarum]|uniref:PTS sugar transporter subunit IIA n=1 Tax=Lactiplantibacillus paraplantarum TaxID=60520 RepID=A0A4Q9XZU3_9LACO|nr:PTS sugar transporter subunit IIA [Lactiplantibacillus paraplantarum]TBX40274.1 PTS sugar transporter subunit IIA [Lactiplantibacillus paraplantarum]
MKIIVSGHGNYASGLHSTIHLLAGDVANIEYVDFTDNMNDIQLSERFQRAVIGEDSAVFMCDLLGGTPFKEAVKLSQVSQKDIAVTSGCNVGALLEVGIELTAYSASAEKLAKKLVEISQVQTKVFHHRVIQVNDEAEGI